MKRAVFVINVRKAISSPPAGPSATPGRVKTHERHTKSGKVVTVAEHASGRVAHARAAVQHAEMADAHQATADQAKGRMKEAHEGAAEAHEEAMHAHAAAAKGEGGAAAAAPAAREASKEAHAETATAEKEGAIKTDDAPGQPGGRRDKLEKEFKLKVEGHRAGETAHAIHQGIQRAADFCNQSPSPCKDNLGIPRKDMPQLSGDPTKPDTVAGSFVEKYRKQGIRVSEGKMPVGKLKATQSEINADKIAGMVAASKAGKLDLTKGDPIIVSKDGYILDGHHRWGALLTMDPHNTMQVVRVGVPIKQLLKDSDKHEGVTKAGFSEGVKKAA